MASNEIIVLVNLNFMLLVELELHGLEISVLAALIKLHTKYKSLDIVWL